MYELRQLLEAGLISQKEFDTRAEWIKIKVEHKMAELRAYSNRDNQDS